MPGSQSPANRKPGTFPPGVSGNPSGRPRSAPVSAAIRAKLDQPFPNDPKGRTYAQVIADGLVEGAASGAPEQLAVAREVMDRVEGKPLQSVEVSSTDTPSEEKLAFVRASGFVLSRTK